MITKLVVKDFVSKRCPYLTKGELEDKSLISLIKESIPLLGDLNDVLAMDQEEGEGESDSAGVLNLTELAKDYPHLRKDIKKLLKEVPLNDVQKLVEKYNDDQLVSKLSRQYFEDLYGIENCVRCDVMGDGSEIVNQDLILKTTNDALENPKAKVIFEGQIEYENLRARFDVLIKNDDGTFDLIEVKGTNNVTNRPKEHPEFDSKIKDKYMYDLLFQYYLYTLKGFKFRSIGFLTTNNQYQMTIPSYPTNRKELSRLFVLKTSLNLKKIGEVSIKDYFDNKMFFGEKSKSQPLIESVIEQINKIDKMTGLKPVKKYECKKGPQCPFFTLCFKDANALNSIFKLTKWNMYGGNWRTSESLMKDGIEHISDIPDHIVQDKFPEKRESDGITKRNCSRLQIDFEKGKFSTKYVLDYNRIKDVLERDYRNDEINWLVFFDFESFQHPIPLVKDSHPWIQVVSQYSMHVVKKGYDLTKHDFDAGKGGDITHFEYIGNPDVDGYENPSFKLYEVLKKQMESTGIDIYGHDYRVVVFNQNFEKSRMKEFITNFGHRVDPELTRFIEMFRNNVVDLLDFFTYGGVYSRDFGGRGSLKVVQPALTTDPNVLDYYHKLNLPYDFEYSLDYHKGDKCQVYNGGICLDLFKCLLVRQHLGQERNGLSTNDLLKEALAYCKIDSWGTVIIYDIIKNVFDGKIKLDSTIIK